MTFKLSEDAKEFEAVLNRFFKDSLESPYIRKRCESSDPSDANYLAKLSELGLQEFFSDPDAESSFLYILARTSSYYLLPEAVAESLLFGPLAAALMTKADRDALEASIPGAFELMQDTLCCQGSLLFAATQKHVSISNGKATGKLRFVTGDEAERKLVFVPHPDFAEKVCCIAIAGATVESEAVLDGSLKRSALSFKDAPCAVLSKQLYESLMLRESLVRAAEVSGAASRVLAMTKEYVAERKQFDVPIGGFQAVQHKLVDAYVALESLDALLRYAAWSLDHAEDQAALSIHSALWKATREGSGVIESLLQIHGGIGFTWEYDLHLYLRRVKSYEALYKPGKESRKRLLEAARV